MIAPFYVEVARRVVRLANALQYENAAALLHLALASADDTVPRVLHDVDVRMQFAFYPLHEARREGRPETYDHAKFDAAVSDLEKWLDQGSPDVRA